jgi:hypothetical protein
MGGIALPFFTFANQKHPPIQQKYAVPKNSTSQDRICWGFTWWARVLYL